MSEVHPTDLTELTKVLEDAKIRLDALTKSPGAIVGGGRIPSLADNNSGCNTSCSCGAAESLAERLARGSK